MLPGVDVTAIQTETGFTRSAVTDAEGSISFRTCRSVRIGSRHARRLPHFQHTGIVLQVNANPTINVTLALGDLTETVAVEAAAPLVETRSPGIGEVIENERIEALPLNGRNATD